MGYIGKQIGVSTVLIATLTACGQDPVDETAAAPAGAGAPAPANVTEVAADIDWPAARVDFAKHASLEAENLVTAQSAGEIAPVPVLLPGGDQVTVQSGETVRFQPLSDGYFAAYPGILYDVIVNGTHLRTHTEGETPPQRRAEAMAYTATAAGAQVALSRYGADYLIEFECNEIDAETGTCISQDDALEIAANLVVAGTR